MSRFEQALARIRAWLEEKPLRADLAALSVLAALWALFFWRALTPNPANQVSYPEGDFSGQFLAFGAYQARRLLAGEVPLWNPYNYAGHPFLADTQAAVFYPPRLVTIFISQFTGGWNYTALQAEALAHYGLGALAMYLFVRTVTRSRLAGLVGGITLAFGGYATGYPPLQLAVLEAGIWLPVSLLAVYRASTPPTGDATHSRWHVRWLTVGALALGVSLLAGHPQTTLFYLYVLLAYMIHRAARARIGWLPTLLAMAGVVGLGFGVAAVQVLPGLEYTRLTIRAGFGFEELAHGFPFGDLVSILLPNVVSVWSPLYSGVAALALAGLAISRRHESARFWAVVVLVALVFSFGGATVLYRLAYLLAPGVAWFRGQERAAYVVAYGVATLTGLGTAAILEKPPQGQRWSRALGIVAGLAWAFAAEVFIVSRVAARADATALVDASFYLAGIATVVWLLLGRFKDQTGRAWWPVALMVLVAFDLFSANIDTNWEPVPPAERELFDKGLAGVALADNDLFRVDGRLGLAHGNFGTLVGLQDIRGISPLRLDALEQYMTHLPDYRLFQLLNAKYVYTDWQQLEIPSTIVARDENSQPPIFVHRLDEPLPRAWMVYRVMVAPDDGQALGWLADPSFDPRTTVILAQEPELDLPATPPASAQVTVETYAPEHIWLRVETPEDGVLVLSEWDYPGWHAAVDGQRVAIWRANTGLRALPLVAGQHEIVFTYRPASVGIGTALTVLSLAAIATGLLIEQKLRPMGAGEKSV